ncbi:unnamed protein product [Sphagnum balticum]
MFVRDSTPLPLIILGNQSLNLAPAPIAVSALDLRCSNIDAAGQTCCNTTTHAQIDAAWQAYSADFLIFQSRIAPNVGNFTWIYDLLPLEVQFLLDEYLARYPQLNGVITTMLTVASQLSNDSMSCMNGMAGYMEGMACVACDPNYARYMNATAVPPTLYLQQETCDYVYPQCALMYSHSWGYAVTAVQQMTIVCSLEGDPFDCAEYDLLEKLATLSITLALLGGAQHCQSPLFNCKAEYCGVAFMGVGFGEPDLPTMSAASSLFGGELIQRLLSSAAELTPINQAIAIATSLLDRVIRTGIHGASELLTVQQQQQQQQQQTFTDGYARVVWSPTGTSTALASYSVGCNANFAADTKTACAIAPPAVGGTSSSSTAGGTSNTPVSSSSATNKDDDTSSSMTIIIVIVVLVLVAVIIGALLYIYRASLPCFKPASNKPDGYENADALLENRNGSEY